MRVACYLFQNGKTSSGAQHFTWNDFDLQANERAKKNHFHVYERLCTKNRFGTEVISTWNLALINREGGLYGRILTEVVSTDQTD